MLVFLWNLYSTRELFGIICRQWQPTPVLLPGKSHGQKSLVGCSPWGRKSWTRLSDFTFTFHFHALEKEMAIHSSVLAWRIPGTGEHGRLLSLGSHRVGHDWSDLAAAAVSIWKVVQYHMSVGNCKLKWGAATCLLEWWKSKKLSRPKAGKDVTNRNSYSSYIGM